MNWLRRFFRRKTRALTVEEFYRLHPEHAPQYDPPKGLRVRQWYRLPNGVTAVDVYWPSWPAYRFGVANPEYVVLDDPYEARHREVSDIRRPFSQPIIPTT